MKPKVDTLVTVHRKNDKPTNVVLVVAIDEVSITVYDDSTNETIRIPNAEIDHVSVELDMAEMEQEEGKFSSPIPSKEFFFGGNAVFTVLIDREWAFEKKIKQHYTYKTVIKNSICFAFLLTGPDNTQDYSYVGILDIDGEVILTGKSKMNKSSWPVRILERIMKRIVSGEADKIQQAGWNVHHEGKCGVCGRPLTTPESILTGIGPICAKKK